MTPFLMQIQPFAERLAKNTNDCGNTMVVITSDLEICPKLFISYTNKHGLGLIYLPFLRNWLKTRTSVVVRCTVVPTIFIDILHEIRNKMAL